MKLVPARYEIAPALLVAVLLGILVALFVVPAPASAHPHPSALDVLRIITGTEIG
jgi:hypothetical protein